jgi:dienelactone hydrolase
LQGHSTGFHNSINEPKTEAEANNQPRVGFAVQSVNEGYITLAVENRAMGERSAENSPGRRVQVFEHMNRCYYETITAQLLGRTMCAERMFDNKCALDVVLEHFGNVIDENKIAFTGNSGGGTASYYMACYDERVKISIPSCGFCPYPESILRFYHCSCNYIPNAYPYFDMQDLSCLIAPRNLVIVAGKYDTAFRIEGVRRGYETVKKVFEKAGVPDNCKLVETEKGHWWCVDVIWKEMKEITDKLGWDRNK